MITNSFEIFYFTLTAGMTGLGLFLVGRTLLNLSRAQTSYLRQERHAVKDSPKRRRTSYVPTLTCSLPIQTQKRAQQRLW